MGQPESKSELKEHYPFYPTDFEIKRIINRTDLNRNEVQILWNHVWLKAVKENGKVDFENFVGHFCQNAWVSISCSFDNFILKGKILMKMFFGNISMCFSDFRAAKGMRSFQLRTHFCC